MSKFILLIIDFPKTKKGNDEYIGRGNTNNTMQMEKIPHPPFLLRLYGALAYPLTLRGNDNWNSPI